MPAVLSTAALIAQPLNGVVAKKTGGGGLLQLIIKLLAACPIAGILAHLFLTWRVKRVSPPGPWPWPVVGNFPHLLAQAGTWPNPIGGGFHRTLEALHKKYGPIMTLWYASKLTIVLGNPWIVQQTHRDQSEKFQHRTLTEFAKLSLKADEDGGQNVALAGGKYWVKARKVFVQELMSKKFIEDVCVNKIMQEIWSAMGAMKDVNEAPFDPHEHLQRLSCNIVYRLTYGLRFDAKDVGNKDSDWGQLCEVINAIMALGGQNMKANYSPFLKKWENLTAAGRALNQRRVDVVARRDVILERLLENHKKTIDEKKPRDFLDVLITRKKKDDLSDVNITYIAWEFITAGTDTTSATMHWLTLLMANHPEAQKKAQKEIDDVCKGRPVNITDQDKLPYLNACIKECMRWMPAVPLMVPYAASEDAIVEVDGAKYTIKQGTQVIVNGFNMHRDPTLWKNADDFDPERFMSGPDADIELKGSDAPNDPHHLKFMPLGTGRRACAGYLLAKLELFLQGATLVQCFNWRPATGDKVPLKEIFGIAVSCAHADVVATWREENGINLAETLKSFGSEA